MITEHHPNKYVIYVKFGHCLCGHNCACEVYCKRQVKKKLPNSLFLQLKILEKTNYTKNLLQKLTYHIVYLYKSSKF